MVKRLYLVVLGSCAALAFSKAPAQFAPAQPNPASGAAQATKRSSAAYNGYPQFSYPTSPVSRQTPPDTRTPSAQRRPQSNDPAGSDPDPYSYDGWNGRSYDPPSVNGPSLNEPWTTNGPADQLPGQTQ